MRLKVVDGKIVESESVVNRKGNPGPFGDPAAYESDSAGVSRGSSPPVERLSRAQMTQLVDGYFSSLQMNDGRVHTRFDPHCSVVENGQSTTGEGCEAQIKLGVFKPYDRVRDRRYTLVDRERGLVVATAFIDRAARYDHYRTTDGGERPTFTTYPNTVGLIARFQIRGGRIAGIEYVTAFLPYLMRSPWPQS